MQAIRHFGGMPLVIPAEAGEQEQAFLLAQCDGLVLTGGNYLVDLAGQNVNVTGTGNVTFFDSANADFKTYGTATVTGVEKLTGATVCAHDLRAGAALVMAALSAEGVSTVDNIHYIARGYEDFHLKLQSLGAQIELINSERELQKFRLKVG